MTCKAAHDIAVEADVDAKECPECTETLETKSNIYGEWDVCHSCGYDSDMRDKQ